MPSQLKSNPGLLQFIDLMVKTQGKSCEMDKIGFASYARKP